MGFRRGSVPAALGAALAVLPGAAAPADVPLCDGRGARADFGRSPSVTDLVRLDGNLGPLRGSGMPGHCFAYAASDFLESWLKRRGALRADLRLSPLALGLGYHRGAWAEAAAGFHARALRALPRAGAVREVRDRARELALGRDDGGLAHHEAVLRHLDGPSPWARAGVPSEGGDALEAVRRARGRACLESEVRSPGRRDLALMLEENPGLFDHALEHPDTVGRALSNLALARYMPDPWRSAAWPVARTFFPGAFGGPGAFLSFLDGLPDHADLFGALVGEACAEKDFPEPRFRRARRPAGLVSRWLGGDGALLRVIDRALAAGSVPYVVYGSRMLLGGDAPDELHGAVVVGSLKVCGEPHYIVRDPIAEGGCHEVARAFGAGGREADADPDVLEMRASMCAGGVFARVREASAGCRGEGCRERERALLDEGMAECGRARRASRPRRQDADRPWFCDPGGNVVVQARHFAGWLAEAAVIVN